MDPGDSSSGSIRLDDIDDIIVNRGIARMAANVRKLQEQLQVSFQNEELLRQAFTHASYRNEHRFAPLSDNERLEFLGDAVLELAVSEYLFEKYPCLPEGELTRMRAAIVCEPSLVTFALQLKFDSYLLLGRGEELTGGRKRPSILADVFEAFVGALYLDQGFAVVRIFFANHLFSLVDVVIKALTDYKTLLQERVQREPNLALVYQIVEERGPAHSREFVAQVLLNGLVQGQGVGKSKKEAEQFAAKEALSKVDSQT
ncbi:MAG: ribonuclease [Bacilli bacterium]|nr:ribonuclease [Bacilli bacterium]